MQSLWCLSILKSHTVYETYELRQKWICQPHMLKSNIREISTAEVLYFGFINIPAYAIQSIDIIMKTR